jgi:hypothetical protein
MSAREYVGRHPVDPRLSPRQGYETPIDATPERRSTLSHAVQIPSVNNSLGRQIASIAEQTEGDNVS